MLLKRQVAAVLAAACMPCSRAVFIRTSTAAPDATAAATSISSLEDIPSNVLGLIQLFLHPLGDADMPTNVLGPLSQTAGLWREKTFAELRAQLLDGETACASGAVLGAAIVVGLEGAPKSLAEVEPACLRDDENVLLAGIWQDWFDWHNLPDAARGSVNVMREFFRVAAEEMERAQIKAEDRSGLAAFDTDQSGLVRVPRKGPMRVMNSLKSLIAQTRTVARQDLDWSDLVGPPVEDDVAVVKQVLRTNQFLEVFETWDDLPLAAKLDVDCVVEAMRTGLLTKGKLEAYRFGSEVRASWLGFFAWLEALHDLDAAPDVATSARAVATALELGVLTFFSQVPEELRGNVAVVTAFLERQMNSDEGTFLERDPEFDFCRDVRGPAATDENVRAKALESKRGEPYSRRMSATRIRTLFLTATRLRQ